MKILIIGVEPYSLYNFRGCLIESLTKSGFEVLAAGHKASKNQRIKIESLGCKYIEYSVNRVGLNPFYELKTLMSFIRMFYNEKPDIILAYSIKPVLWAGIASRFFKNINFYALITGTGYAFGSGSLLRKLIKRVTIFLYNIALSKSQNIIFQNQDNQKLFSDLGVVKDSSKTCVIEGSGVDLDQFAYKPINKKNIKYDFIMIARLLKDKGVMEFIEAISIVKERYPNSKFLLVGPKEQSPNSLNIDTLLKNYSSDFLTYYDWIDDVRPMIINSSIFVLPSYHEGLPRSVLEAMAIGRPILTTNAPGCKDTVIDGYNGWLVPKQNSYELAQKMIWFIKNPDMHIPMGENSRKLVEDKFDVKIVNKKMLDLFFDTK